jgi:hypothetical protein
MPAWFWILVVILLAVFIGFLARRSGDPARRQPVSVVSEPQRDRLVTTPERSVHAEAATPAGGGYAAPMATEVPAASAGEARIRTGATVASATAGRLEEHPPTELADEATGRADEATGSADQPDTRATRAPGPTYGSATRRQRSRPASFGGMPTTAEADRRPLGASDGVPHELASDSPMPTAKGARQEGDRMRPGRET